MRLKVIPRISRETLLACMLASAKRYGVTSVAGVPTAACETLNDLDELMSVDMELAITDLLAALNDAFRKQVQCQQLRGH